MTKRPDTNPIKVDDNPVKELPYEMDRFSDKAVNHKVETKIEFYKRIQAFRREKRMQEETSF